MPLLSKAEIEFLQGTKQVSKSYEYKINSILKKKLTNLFNRDLPLLTSLFPEMNLTKFSKKIEPKSNFKGFLTNYSKIENNQNMTLNPSNVFISYNNLDKLEENYTKTTWAGSDAGQICL